ncbi:hypothetical protein [Peribacillus simplex]|uniref:hypothetical protein n=1 Tax=Peribacillus simplex TaxID=1478 RepID=UPI0024C1C2BB|nr:hypothetical protein [Peribacillus simplex]WHY55894.1 hypothetical protein QNH43_22550 [Peribacillus simplex]
MDGRILCSDSLVFYCNPHWIEGARLLPNNWLAKTPQALASMRCLGRQSAERDFKAKLIGTESECPTFQSTSTKERERIFEIN